MTETATYWDPTVPGGYTEARKRPEAYEAAVKLDADTIRGGDNSSWRKILQQHGYSLVFSWNGTREICSTSSEIMAFRHETGHLVVEVISEEHYVSYPWFVEARWASACLASELPRLMAQYSAAEGDLSLNLLDKTIRAFVRHGQGERTIDEYGGTTLDERRREMEYDRARRRMAADA